MRMIIGGFAQGKTRYAIEKYNVSEEHLIFLNKATREAFEKGEDMSEELQQAVAYDRDLIIITDEVGRGVVPAEKSEREFREYIGRLQIKLAEQADEVVRVICGIGQKIK